MSDLDRRRPANAQGTSSSLERELSGARPPLPGELPRASWCAAKAPTSSTTTGAGSSTPAGHLGACSVGHGREEIGAGDGRAGRVARVGVARPRPLASGRRGARRAADAARPRRRPALPLRLHRERGQRDGVQGRAGLPPPPGPARQGEDHRPRRLLPRLDVRGDVGDRHPRVARAVRAASCRGSSTWPSRRPGAAASAPSRAAARSSAPATSSARSCARGPTRWPR